MALFALNELNINAATKMSFLSYNLNSRPSSKKISEIFRPLLTISEISIGKTPNIS